MKSLSLFVVTVSLALLPTMVRAQELSKEEKDAGFLSLFNGKDLSGWMWMGKGDSPFSFQDGTIHYKGGGNWLCYTEKEFPDFELRLEFKLIKKGGDGGVFFRATKDAGPSERYELQVKDYAEQGRLWGLPYKLDKDKVAKARKPQGEWEEYRLIVLDKKIEVYLNGELVTTADTATYKKNGYLGLQAEGGEEAFRNIRIKPLSKDK